MDQIDIINLLTALIAFATAIIGFCGVVAMLAA